MAEFSYYDKYISIKGIWLIDSNQLEKLDEILDANWKKMISIEESNIEIEIERVKNEKNIVDDLGIKNIEGEIKDSYRHSRNLKQITIYLPGAKIIKAESFKEILKDQRFTNEKPKNFSVKLVCGEIEAELTLGKDFDGSEIYFKVNHQELEFSQELIYEMGKWVKDVKRPSWQKIFTIDRLGIWIFSFLFMVVSSLFVIWEKPQYSYNDELRKQSYELLKDSLTKEKEYKALELLLKLNIGYVSPDYKTIPGNSNNWILYLQIIVLIVLIVLSIRPTVLVGIGKGEKYINYWKTYFRFVSLILSIIFLYFFLPYIYNRLL